MAKQFNFSSTSGLLDHALSLDYGHPNDGGEVAIPVHRVDGSKLVVVVGDNAGGKSFFRRVISAVCAQSKAKTECIGISMEGRAKVSHAPWLAMVYGDEGWESTGTISSTTVTTGIKTCLSRKSRHVVFWDEPDLGLSDSWAAGVGKALRKFSEKASEHTIAAFVVTHSRALVSELLESEPTYLHVGKEPSEAPQRLGDWVHRPIEPRDISLLSKESHKRFKLIQKILDDTKP